MVTLLLANVYSNTSLMKVTRICKVYLFLLASCLQIEKASKEIVVTLQSRTGTEQGFPCVVILTGKNLFSLQGTPLLIAGILYSLQGFPCENYYTGRSL